MKYKFNGEKLRTELKKRDVNLAEASLAIGHSSNYLCVVIKKNEAEEHVFHLLEAKFNIRREDISDEPPKQEPKNDIEEMVYRGVLRALREVGL